MSKTLIESTRGGVMPVSTPPLSPSVRRHLGKSLRSFYAASLTEPVSERIEALLARLDAPRR